MRLEDPLKDCGASLLMNRPVDAALIQEQGPDLLVWAARAIQNIPEIKGLDDQHLMTSIEYFQDEKEAKSA